MKSWILNNKMILGGSGHERLPIIDRKPELLKTRHSEMKSFPRWLIVASGLALLALIGGGFWFYFYQKQDFRQNSEASLQAAAQLKVNQIAQWRSEQLRDAAAISESPFLTEEVQRFFADPQAEVAGRILSRFRAVQELYHYGDVMLVDRDGQVRLSLSKHPGFLHEDAARSLAEALRERKPVLGDLHVGPADLPPHIDVVAPLFSETRKTKDPIGAVILQLDARQFLYPLIHFWPTPSRSAETLLVRREGDAVLFLNDLRHQPDTALKLRIPLNRKDVPAVMAVLGKEGVVDGTDYRGVNVLSVLKAIPNSPWFMIAKVDEAEALAGGRFRSILILALVIGLLAFLVTAGGMAWQKKGKAHYKELFLAEAALRRVEEGHRIILMSVGDGIISTDTDGRVELLNPVAEALTGWRQEEAYGKPLEEVFRIFNEETRRPVENPVSKVLCEGLVVGLANHTVLRAQDGTERPIADSAAPVRDEHGAITGVVLVFRDQSKERAVEKLLWQEKEQTHQYLDVAGVMLLVLDTNGHVKLVNRKGCEILGYEEGDVLGKDWFEHFLSDKVRDEVKGVFSGIIAGHLEMDEYVENVVRTSSGEARLIAWHNSVLRDRGGSIIGILSSGEDITERRRTEGNLRDSEARLRDLYDNAPNAYFSVGTDGFIRKCNKGAEELLGYPREILEGKLVFDLYMDGTEGKERAAKVFEKFISGEQVTGEELQMKKADESPIWISLSVNALRDADGQVVESRSAAVDITERKRAEDRLRESETRFVAAFRNSPVSLVITSAIDGKYVDVNDRFLRHTGYTREEVIGHTSQELQIFADYNDRERLLSQVRKQGYVHGLEMGFRIKSGEILTCLISTTVVHIGGQPHFLSTIVDITDLKKSQKALKESEERFRRIFEQGPLALAIVGLDCRWLAVNAALCEMIGYSEDELAGLTFVDITHPDDIEVNLEYAVKLARGEIPFYRMEKRYIKKSGEICWIHVTGSVVRDGQGKELYFLSMIEDISDRKRMEELALQSARLRAVADLSSGVAHHFNNLLQIIMASTSLSLMELESGDLSKTKTTLEKMLEATSLGAVTVRRLQTFANVRADIAEGEAAVFDVATTATNAAEVSRPFWKSDPEKKGIRIDMQLDLEDGCLVKGQENEVFEVLVNLIRNAAEAMPNGGDMEVRAHVQGKDVVVEVRDTGIGIAEDDLPRVFQPFWSTRGVAIGKGMGLAVTHGLVKRHGGAISVQSKEGKGTTFTIRLPLAREPAGKTEEPEMGPAEGHLTILVIDDDLNIATLLERICAKVGNRVFKALSGEEGLAIFNDEPVDLVLCDLGMPGMNGWQVGKAIGAICRDKGTAKPGFVLLTGWGGQELEREKIAESGVDAVVAKPIDATAVISTVRDIAARGMR